MRILRPGEVVRIPPDLPHTIESVGERPLRTERLTFG
jgi:mannose-6-phosphate isomerase-like protein (cupin superfamily)